MFFSLSFHSLCCADVSRVSYYDVKQLFVYVHKISDVNGRESISPSQKSNQVNYQLIEIECPVNIVQSSELPIICLVGVLFVCLPLDVYIRNSPSLVVVVIVLNSCPSSSNFTPVLSVHYVVLPAFASLLWTIWPVSHGQFLAVELLRSSLPPEERRGRK